VPVPLISTQSNAGPPGSRLSDQRLPNASGPPALLATGPLSTSGLPLSTNADVWIGSGGAAGASRVAEVQSSALPPPFVMRRLRLAAVLVLSVSSKLVGFTEKLGAATPSPVTTTVRTGVSGSLLAMSSVPARTATAVGCQVTVTLRAADGATTNEPGAAVTAASEAVIPVTCSESVPLFVTTSVRV
jgi:hypothetical protein